MLASLKIMFLMGFRNVFMMGADFKMTENYTYHFDEQRAKGAVKGNMDTYQKLSNQYFPELKPFFDAEGFHVYNCNPESELKVFDYVAYEDAIAFASKDLGDVDNERTWGMYSKPDERQKWINEPDNKNKIHLGNIPSRSKTPVFIDSPIDPSKDTAPVQQQNIPVAVPMPQQPQQEQQIVAGPISKPMPKPTEPPSDITQMVGVPKSTPMGSNVRIDPSITTDQPNRKVKPNVTIVDLKKGTPQTPPVEQGNRIVRSMPCGGGISFGSSGSTQNNITIEDNGR